MKLASCVLLPALLCSLAFAQAPEKKVYPKRWVYVSNELGSDKDLAAVREIVETAAAHGLNGMVFAAGLDRIDLQPAAYIARLKEVKQLCDRLHFEIAPIGFGTGYGGALLSHDKNLAEGLPVKGALYVAGKGKAEFQAEAEPFVLASTGAEPVARFEKLLALKPYRCYRVSARVRGTGVVAPDATLEFRADTLDKKRNQCWFERPIDNRREWQSYTTAFNSGPNDKLNFNIAIEDGLAGKLEIADLKIEEVGLLNVLRRAGTPLAVHGDSGIHYLEGKDFARVTDPVMNFLFDRPSVAITLPAGSRIKEGERLRVDYYHGMTIYKDQTPACPSEPKVYEIWGKQLPLIQKYLAPKAYLLSVDEERMGGTCETCKRRKMGMAEMMGTYVERLEGMMKAVSPGAEIFVWSDMFDPNHNAVPNYYLVDGDYTGSWKYLPKDVEIAAWNYDTREKTLPFFSKLGYKTLAAAYYDADDLKNPVGWLESLDRTPGAIGIMYTTWQNKFKLLPDFGDMVSKRK